MRPEPPPGTLGPGDDTDPRGAGRFPRHRPPRGGFFRSPLRGERTAVRIGLPLGVTFTICFLTGLISHFEQHPPNWLTLPSQPVWGYRLTQGLHVASGLAAIPLLLIKLWSVYPKLFQWPPVRSLVHAVERLGAGVLVACGVFELFSGLLNTLQWYPWPFPFIQTHYWVAWITIGALLLHISAKLPQIREHAPLRSRRRQAPPDAEVGEVAGGNALPVGAVPETAVARGGMSRRGLMIATTAAVGVVTVTTVGQSFTPLKSTDLLAPRNPDGDPQGLPLNRTAVAAGVTTAKVTGSAWVLDVVGPRPYRLTLDELNAMPQYEADLPIACVEGWSKNAGWGGVRIRDLMDRAGAPPGSQLRVISLDWGAYGQSILWRDHAADPLTLLALRLNGEVLNLDHGYPARIIAPNRPGALQTKWVTRLEVEAPS